MLIKNIEELLLNESDKRYLESVFERIEERNSIVIPKTTLSVSKLINKLKPAFDQSGLADKLSKTPGHEMFGKSIDEIVSAWSNKTDDAASTGTSIDKLIQTELHVQPVDLLSIPSEQASTMIQFRALTDLLSANGIFAIASQVKVYNSDILGFLDELYFGQDKLFLIDFKTYSDLDKAERSYNEYMRGPLSKVQSSKLSAATTQLFLYKYLLEQEYGLNIAGCRLFNLREHDYTILYPTYKYDAGQMRECISYGLEN